MSPEWIKLCVLLYSLIGPANKYVQSPPNAFILKEGDQIVAIGDSITDQGGYLRDIDAVLAAKYPALKLPPIINVGISGQKAEDLVGRFEKDVIHAHTKDGQEVKPALVTISIGVNDVWHRVEKPHDPEVLATYWKNVDKMVQMAQDADIKVILLTPTLIGEDISGEGNQRLILYSQVMKEIGRARQCTVVDLHQVFVDAVAKRPADRKGRDPWLTVDGVHMRPEGDGLMAIGVLRAMGVPDAMIRR